MNEKNLGIGYRSPGDIFYEAGLYKNSLYRTSVYADAGIHAWQAGRLTFNIMAGVVTGYDRSVAPFVVPQIEVRLNNHLSVLALYIPKVTYHNEILNKDAAIGFSISFRP